MTAVRRAKSRRAKLALAVLALALAVVALEVGARVHLGKQFMFGAWVGAPQAICGEFDPELGWRNRPDTSVRCALGGGSYRVTINSRGQRGPVRDFAKPSGVKRVVLLGDSTAWGWGVGDEDMWPRLVESEFGGAVEIVNLAVPGYGTDQELWVLERDGVRYAPDLVLLAFVHNDTLSNDMATMQGMAKPQLVRGGDGEWTVSGRPVAEPAVGSDLAGRRARRVASMYLATARLFEPPPAMPSRLKLDDPKVQAGIERFWNEVTSADKPSHELLARMQAASAKAGAKFAVFHFPHLVDRWLYDPTTPLPPLEPGATYETYGTRKLAEAGRELGFATFSIDQALRDVVSTGVNLDCGDEHLNERGNAIVAKVVAAKLRELLGL